jgi:uncharacterized protein (TIGR02246 family)
MNAAALVQRQLDAYNARDLDSFVACYAENCVLAALNGAVAGSGRQALRDRYAKTFAENPDNQATLLGRIHLGNIVVDHEDVTRGPGKERFQVLAIYTVKDGKIARVDFAK